jgi:hypothetical protein
MSDEANAGPNQDEEELESASSGEQADHKARKKRTPRPFPGTSFLEALPLAEAIQTHGAGQKTRRLSLFEALDRSPDSGSTRKLITSSVQYGLTTGGYSAEWLALTAKGAIASSPTAAARAQRAARLELAITEVTPFNSIAAADCQRWRSSGTRPVTLASRNQSLRNAWRRSLPMREISASSEPSAARNISCLSTRP